MRQFVIVFISVFITCMSYAATCPDNQFMLNAQCVNCIYNATCDGAIYKCNDGFYDDGATYSVFNTDIDG